MRVMRSIDKSRVEKNGEEETKAKDSDDERETESTACFAGTGGW